jgi:hypothetical protein
LLLLFHPFWLAWWLCIHLSVFSNASSLIIPTLFSSFLSKHAHHCTPLSSLPSFKFPQCFVGQTLAASLDAAMVIQWTQWWSIAKQENCPQQRPPPSLFLLSLLFHSFANSPFATKAQQGHSHSDKTKNEKKRGEAHFYFFLNIDISIL